MSLPKSLPGLVLVLVCLASAISPAQAQTGPDQPRLLAPTGPHAVGRSAFHWLDEDRAELHTPDDPDDRRELLVEVWYPADPEPNAAPGSYYSQPLADLFSTIFSVPGNRLHGVLANAYPDAPLAADEARYPVVIFDPGFSGMPRQYTIFLEELASHGYVVFSTSRPYITTLTAFPDGRLIEPLSADRLATLWAPRDIYEAEFSEVWVPDLDFVLAQIAQLDADDPAGRFSGRLDLERLGVIGHSQGARTVSEICLRDTRCQGAINLDGAYSAGVQVGYARPYLMMLADNGVDNFVSTFRYGLEAIPQDYYVLMIPGTQHNSFQDLAFWLPLVFEGDLTVEIMAAQVAVLDYRAYMLAFFGQVLRDQPAPLLAGPDPDRPEVFFLAREEPVASPVEGVTPQPVTPGETQRGTLTVGSAEVWTYTARAGEVVNIYLLADRPANQTNQQQRERYGLLDTLLVLRAPDGSMLAANDDFGLGTNSALEGIMLPAAGEYRIEVRSWQSQTAGDYTLLIEPVKLPDQPA
jgi:predicted dienelactone hydrolase